ncbi:hypothetical protein BG844_05785 [Couchioplanes caeruleus subsp. caeruleus]|uniref:Uncharacterized protein n=1 Tax=Couchioplanes caeruleus subsp. caeruleus TaxID=56427 RepID=A0A1K0GS07_9ACTN|nr:hypothetical protein BG844_05785 [Couchioplanes caeruleus subsp. caeruleus]
MTNSYAGWLTLWLEPLGEDRWLRPGETFRIRSDYDGEERDFVVDFWVDDEDRAAGIANVTVSIERGNPDAEVTDDNGGLVECGHQRPPEIDQKWAKAREKWERRATP